MPPTVTYDKEVKILNVKFNNHHIADTMQTGNCILDYDEKGNVVNIEILDVNIDEVITDGVQIVPEKSKK